jgi:hypothetical protein
MRSRFAWLLAGFGAVTAASRLLRRRQAATAPPEPEVDPRADELRRRIEDSRGLEEERQEFEAAEVPIDEADPEARRRHVHERGRAAAERMRAQSPPE